MPSAQQRRAAQKRRLKRQQSQRMKKDALRRRNSLIISIIGVLVVAAIVLSVLVAGNNDSSTPSAGSTGTSSPSIVETTILATSPQTTPKDPYPCSWLESGNAAKAVAAPADDTPPKSGKVNLLVNTSQGAMTFQLDRSLAPCAVESFITLAQQSYFNQTPCHRLTTSGFYVLQCGDPLGTGLGGPGYTIPDEATGDEEYPAGTIAMARTANPHSGGSQFFIVYKDSPSLQQGLGVLQYTVFGKVTSGLDVIDKVAQEGSTPRGDGKPNLPININSIALVE